MPNFNTAKGLHNVKTAQNITKNSDSDSDLLKLYILKKERERLIKEKDRMRLRLLNEKDRIQLRLEQINSRLKEVEEYFTTVMESIANEIVDRDEDRADFDQKGSLNV